MARSARLSLTGFASLGVVMVVKHSVDGLLGSLREIEKHKGALATLGMQNIDSVVQKGRQLQVQFADISAVNFVAAAYDIKSGIASLTDTGVAGITAAASITAKATQALPEEMTALFASAYGIFKRQFAQLSDTGFADLFAASLAKSVQQFKTTGPKMRQAIESAGAFAASGSRGQAAGRRLLGFSRGM